MTESLFASPRRYLSERNVYRYVDRHYPILIAHTDSCARPASSVTLCSKLLVPVFAGCCESLLDRRPFPTLSLPFLRKCLIPYPVTSCWCSCSLLPSKHWLCVKRDTLGTRDHPHNATCPTVRFQCVSHRERSMPVREIPQLRYASERISSAVFHSHRVAPNQRSRSRRCAPLG
jgi:hypothetical protein